MPGEIHALDIWRYLLLAFIIHKYNISSRRCKREKIIEIWMGKLVFLSYPENCESAAFVKTASAIEFNIDVADSREERAVFFCSVKHILIYIRGFVVINLFVCAQDLMFAMNNLHCISSMETGILPKYQLIQQSLSIAFPINDPSITHQKNCLSNWSLFGRTWT